MSMACTTMFAYSAGILLNGCPTPQLAAWGCKMWRICGSHAHSACFCILAVSCTNKEWQQCSVRRTVQFAWCAAVMAGLSLAESVLR